MPTPFIRLQIDEEHKAITAEEILRCLGVIRERDQEIAEQQVVRRPRDP